MQHNLTYYQDGKEYFFDRENIENEHYIAACSALSFHKSLIGLSELNALEQVKDTDAAGGLRVSRAINTYYIVFHLFISLMLIDENYKIKLRNCYCQNGSVKFGVRFDDLSDSSQLPETWNNFSSLEQDLATLLTHYNIKQYCEKLRLAPEGLDMPHEILYNHFIYANENSPNTSIKGLYEKLCYVRDRAIYRPSNVLNIDGGYIQTSKYVRKEIDNLPCYSELIDIVKNIYLEILRLSDKKGRNIYGTFIFHLWTTSISDDIDYVSGLGYEVSELANIRFMKDFNNKEWCFSSYVSQLLELVDKPRLFSDLNTIWGDFIKITLDHTGNDKWYY